MDTFTFSSFKGGTAKTSTSLHIGTCLAKFYKKRVLLVDFDSQANLSVGLDVGPDSLKTMAPVLQEESGIKDVIQSTIVTGLDLVAANAYLDGIERTPQLGNDPYAHERLRCALQDVKQDYDFCFLDTPPSLGWLTQSAFFASQYSIICTIPEAYSMIALRRLKGFHEDIRKHHDISVFGVILSFWDERGAVNQEFLEEVARSFPNKIFDAKIRRDIVVSRSTLQGQTVFEYDSDSRAAQDYKALTKEFVKRYESQKGGTILNENLSKAGMSS